MAGMQLEGVHHVTCITGDAQGNVDFYVGLLGLRLVKKSVNQDDPSVYHLFYADEHGDPGSDLTFFEYKGARPGRAGAGMVHRICWRVASADALDFWAARLGSADVSVEQSGDWLRFRGGGGPRPPPPPPGGAGPAARPGPPHTPPRPGVGGLRGGGRRRVRRGGEPQALRGDARLRSAWRGRLGGARQPAWRL